MIWINVKLAISAIRGAKLRSFLTMFAVIVGICAFTLITAFFEGFRASVTSDIDSLGGNLITVNPGQAVERDEEGNVTNFNPFASFGASTLTEKDLKSIQNIDGVTAAAPQMLVSGTVSHDGQEVAGPIIIATNEDYPAALNQDVVEGAFFEDDQSNKLAVLGSGLAENIFGTGNPLGQKIKVRNQQLTITGVMEKFEQGFLGFGGSIDNAVFISLSAGKKLNNGVTLIQEIDIQVAKDADIDTVADEINQALLKNHGGEEDFTVLKQDELLGITDNILDQMKIASQVIAVIMLVVSAVVILLIMLIVVRERTREIGIRKSIGATNANILVQFLTEAVVITWMGSLFGFIVAYIIGLIVAGYTDITPHYSVNSLLVLVIVSTIVGTIAGIIPAAQAARKDPVEALRYE